MTPQERDLITSLFGRLHQAANAPKDREAEALIGSGLAAEPNAPYLLVQTVLIQDMALSEAHNRLKALEAELAAAKSAPAAAPEQPTSFLASGRGSVPSAGPWGRAAPPPPQPAPGPVWTQSGAAAAPPVATPQPAMMQPMAPLAAPSASSGFLRQAASTAAGIAGGALLFQGISSLFGPHYGGGFLSGMAPQPGIGETVINNYYRDSGANAPDTQQADMGAGYNDPGYNDPGTNDPGIAQADDTQDFSNQDVDNQDFGNQDFGQDDSSQDFGSDQDMGGGDSFDV